jgi:hypothetical protein
MDTQQPATCPACQGEITFGYGLAGGGDSEGNPSHYYMCLDCDWISSAPQQTMCFPHGLVDEPKE